MDLPTIGGRFEESVDSLKRSEIGEQFTTNVHAGVEVGSRAIGDATGVESVGDERARAAS